MPKQRVLSSDLHMRYKRETGEWYQYTENSMFSGHYNSTDGYSREYGEWLEEKLLEVLNQLNISE